MEADDPVLTYLNDDGTMVEPEYYVPIIPFALVNGISGIGTGFSSNVAPYDPLQIIAYLKNRIQGLSIKETNSIDFVPYFEGFTGTVKRLADQKYLVKGRYEVTGEDQIRITELPVGTWTMPYTTFLEGLMDGPDKSKAAKPEKAIGKPLIKDFTSMSTEVTVDFHIQFQKGQLKELLSVKESDAEIDGVEKLLKLSTTVTSTNMHMFDSDCKLHKYQSVEDVIEAFYPVRMKTYGQRKAYLVDDMEKRLVRLSNRANYIQLTLSGAIDLRRKTGEQVVSLLTEHNFVMIDGDFKYLVKMPMDSVTEENVAKIMAEKASLEADLATLRGTTLEQIWLSELDTLEKEYRMFKTQREKTQNPVLKKTKTVVKKVVKKSS